MQNLHTRLTRWHTVRLSCSSRGNNLLVTQLKIFKCLHLSELMPNYSLFCYLLYLLYYAIGILHVLCVFMMANSSCLWTKARENLPADVKEWLASLEQGMQASATATEQIDALIEQTTTKQKDLEKSNHRFTKYFDKIIHWLDKVKGIGDVISSFDPVHAALPWAAFRFALQVTYAPI